MRHAVIYVPGFGDERSGSQRLVVKLWQLYGIHSEVVIMGWSNHESFESKLKRLVSRIDSLHATGYQVSLVGVSAGATAVINAYTARKDSVHRVVCLCGPLRGTHTPSGQRGHGAFASSQAKLYSSYHSLSAAQRKNILSIRPQADSVVPPEDTKLAGAQQQVIPTAGHVLSIGLGITIYSWKIIGFIRH